MPFLRRSKDKTCAAASVSAALVPGPRAGVSRRHVHEQAPVRWMGTDIIGRVELIAERRQEIKEPAGVFGRLRETRQLRLLVL